MEAKSGRKGSSLSLCSAAHLHQEAENRRGHTQTKFVSRERVALRQKHRRQSLAAARFAWRADALMELENELATHASGSPERERETLGTPSLLLPSSVLCVDILCMYNIRCMLNISV